MRKNRSLWLTITGLVVFGVGVWLSLTLLNLEVEAVFEGITTDRTYTVVRSPSWDDDRITADLFEISLQDTFVTAVSMDANGGDIRQMPQASKAVPPDSQIGDQFPSPNGAHTLTISGERGNPTIRLGDQVIGHGIDPAWSPDSNRFAFVNKASEILVYDVDQSQLDAIYPPLKIACPLPVVPPTASLSAAITNKLDIPFPIRVEASTTPHISVTPRTEEALLPASASQSLTWNVRTTSADRYQFEISIVTDGFSTLRTCGMVVTPSLLGSIGLRAGYALAAAIMAAGFALMLPRIVTRKYLWSKILSAAPFLAIIAFQIMWVFRLL